MTSRGEPPSVEQGTASRGTVVITGGASGIGRAVALLCGELGDSVAVLDRDADAARRVAAEATKGQGGAGVGLECDVARESSVRDAFRVIADTMAPIRGIVANAGIEENGPTHETSLVDWRRVLDANLDGTFLTCREGIRHGLAQKRLEAIVCVSSPAAFTGFAGGGNASYTASKGGISALVRSLALDYAAVGIRVNGLVPGATNTPLMSAQPVAAVGAQSRDSLAERAARVIPLGRMAHPTEIAQAAVWLLSDAASYVTGSHLFCDGGLSVKSANDF